MQGPYSIQNLKMYNTKGAWDDFPETNMVVKPQSWTGWSSRIVANQPLNTGKITVSFAIQI